MCTVFTFYIAVFLFVLNHELALVYLLSVTVLCYAPFVFPVPSSCTTVMLCEDTLSFVCKNVQVVTRPCQQLFVFADMQADKRATLISFVYALCFAGCS